MNKIKCLIASILIGFSTCSFAALPSAIGEAPLPSLAPILDKATPAVVNIATKNSIQERENPLLRDPFFRRFFRIPNQPRKRSSQSLGSGVIIDAAKGYIITNHHVINKADEITVTLRDGRDFTAKVVGSDPESDVAVIQISAKNLVHLKIANSDRLRVGDFVVAIGNPFGLGQTVTSGIVSALGRTGLGIEGYEDFIQTDASINPGNSGGALINLRGELVGINTAIIAPSGGNVGIGFAIPSNMAISLKNQIVKFGEVNRGQLGITVQDLTKELSQAFKLPRKSGVVISQVQAGSSAEKAGLLAGDIVLTINGRTVKSSANLRNILGLLSVGDTAKLTTLRNGKSRTASLKISKKVIASVKGNRVHKKLTGAKLSNLTTQDKQGFAKSGIKVTDIKTNSTAWIAGVRKGDIITMANRIRVKTLIDLINVTKGQKPLLLNIQRGNSAFFLLIR
ncbi:MAG: serine endoprotease DegQ [Cycloclasticus sp. symbiont of Poecilosclerida sp. M]|nr:MAG: serine endoprotease DegQ [Cycloclasticus sp. symbiont of Poecilosclerida sp. M]